MRASTLDQRVSIQNRTIATDTEGQTTQTWATASTVWAEVREMRGEELFESQQIVATSTHKVTLRYDANVNPKSRFLLEDGTTALTILSVIRPDRRGDMLQALCTEVKT